MVAVLSLLLPCYPVASFLKPPFRFCGDVHVQFKKGDIFFNYGCFPQTWEDPTFVHPDAEGCRGDNDPLDVCEIGARIIKCGVSLKNCNFDGTRVTHYQYD